MTSSELMRPVHLSQYRPAFRSVGGHAVVASMAIAASLPFIGAHAAEYEFGEGKLRKAVAQMLEGHPLVSSWRLGGPSEGGGGATVVELKD